MKVALDTNILVAYFNGEPQVVQRVKTAQQLFLPLPVLAECLFGAKNSVRVAENLAKLRTFRGSCNVLPIEESTAEFYADISPGASDQGPPHSDERCLECSPVPAALVTVGLARHAFRSH